MVSSLPCQLRLIVAAVGIDFQRALLHVLRYFLQLIFGKRNTMAIGCSWVITSMAVPLAR